MADPLLDVVARVMFGQTVWPDHPHSWETVSEATREVWRDQASAVLDAIAETRRLLPVGGAVVVATTDAAEGFTERVEWACGPEGATTDQWWSRPVRRRETAATEVAFHRQRFEHSKACLLRRNVYIGPWEPVAEGTTP